MSHEIALRWTAERVRLGFSQADMARKLDVSRETIRKWENGLAVPNSEALSVTFGFGFDIQYILTGVRSEAATQAMSSISIGSVAGVGVAQDGANVSVVNTQRHITKTIAQVKPGEDHISDAQAATLKSLVDKIVDIEAKVKRKPATHQSVWATLNKFCKVTTYRLIPAGRFDAARKYLDQWIGRLNAMSSAPVKDGDNWRKRHYSYIKVNTKDPADGAALAAFLQKLGVTSLTDLSNDDLEKVYRYIAGRRSKRRHMD